MADNIITPDDMPRPLAEKLAIDHAKHGTCFYRWRAEWDEYERIAPHAVDAAAWAYIQTESYFMARGL